MSKVRRGSKHSRWTVIGAAPSNALGARRWLCRCKCGTERIVLGKSLRAGTSRSCGCLMRETSSATCIERNAKQQPEHSLAHSPTWSSWWSMRSGRPYDEKGITGIVFPRWLGPDGFDHFLVDMGVRPPDTTIDRFPNRRGNYEPGNCRWATRAEQTQNSRKAKLDAEQVKAIRLRAAHGESVVEIVRSSSVGRCQIGKIIRRESWSNIP